MMSNDDSVIIQKIALEELHKILKLDSLLQPSALIFLSLQLDIHVTIGDMVLRGIIPDDLRRLVEDYALLYKENQKVAGEDITEPDERARMIAANGREIFW